VYSTLAHITLFSLRKSSSASHVTVTVNSRDVCIAPDTYLCSREEWDEVSQVYSTLQS
jgi:hypothetical protein